MKTVYPICQILAHTWTDMTTQGISQNFTNVKKFLWFLMKLQRIVFLE